MRKAIVVGWINKGKEADCGETMKNQLMIKRLEEFYFNYVHFSSKCLPYNEIIEDYQI